MNRRYSIFLMRNAGRVIWHLALNERKKSILHLRQAFGKTHSQKEVVALSKAVFDNLSICLADAVRLPNLVREGLDNYVDVKGLHHLTDEVAKGRGVMIQTGHYGNWELLGTWLVQKGIPLRVLAKRTYDPRLDRMIVGYRNSAGYYSTARGNASGAILKGLKKGYVYGMLFDVDTKVKGVFVDFFGKPAHTAVIPAMLAAEYDVPVVPVFIRLNADLTYTITCHKAIKLKKSDDPGSDALANTQSFTLVYEAVIREDPKQWIWMHARWKKQPTGVA
ncbi:MAG: lysophospholipid acyltransferase family protein [Desulfobacterales bacterium]|nr:lysophospholipid acyltransferase family protein [Desulfobacterales bacterium]